MEPQQPLLEREQQLAVLDDALATSRRGAGRLVLVRGEAGIGKTSLVDRFGRGARGARVVAGACDPLSTPRPLGPIVDIVRQVDDGAATLTPETARQKVFDRFLAILSASPRMTVAVIEDAHWADEATLDLLRFVGRRLHTTGGMAVVTYRDDELGPGHPLTAVAGDLATAPATITVDLHRLSVEALAELVAGSGRAGRLDPAALHRVTAGNPFFASEVLADDSGRVPSSVRDAVVARASRLPAAARRVLEVAAVVPTRAEAWLLENLTGATAEDLDACVTGGVLRSDRPGTVAFRHELARQAIADALPPARRASLHAGVAAALIDRDGDTVDAARVAHHAEAAGDRDLVRSYAPVAAERATRLGAHREAAAQYERALRHADPFDDARLADLLEAYHYEAGLTDDADAALSAVTRAAALRRRLGDRRLLGDSLRLQAGALWGVGRSEAAGEMAMTAVALLEELEPGTELADAYAFAASHAMLTRDHEAALAWGAKASALAERVGADRALVRALNSVGSTRILNGDRAGLDDLRRSIAVAEASGHDNGVAVGWGNIGSGSGEVRDYATAEEGLEHTIAFASERDMDANVHYATAWLARVRFEQGRWHEADDLLRTVPLRSTVGSPIVRIVGLTVAGRLRARRGGEDPWPPLDEAWALAVETGDLQRLWPAAAARAEAAWLGGDGSSVPSYVEGAVPLALRYRHPWAVGELALWLHRGGALAGVPAETAEPFALHIAGRHRDAAAAWEELGCPYEAADALSDSGDEPDLRRALEVLDDLGALAAARRVRRRLRETGARNVPRGPHTATAAHPAGLTPRQAEVLDLVARGLSDAEIAHRLHVSRKTVGHHVSAILTKLAVASRGEAAHTARERGLVAEKAGDPGGEN